MNNKKSILFLYGTSKFKNNAYAFRLDKFKDYFLQNNFNVKSIYLKDSIFPVPSLFQPFNLPFFLKELKTSDLVHAGNTPCAYLCKVTQKFTKTKFIYDVHGNVIQENSLNFDRYNVLDIYNMFQTQIMEHIASSSNYFITCSTPLKNYYIKQGVKSEKIEIIRNGVDLNLFKCIKYATVHKEFTVSYAGGFQKWQGINNLIEAIRLTKKYNLKFKIIGFSSKDQILKEKLHSEFGESVNLINSLKREELVKQLNDSDLLIIPRNRHPAIEYAFPTKFAEYLSVGKPILVTDVDETAEFVKKYNCGFICDPNPQSIAEAIIRATTVSEKSLYKMGQNARKLAETEFDQKIINDKYLNFVSKILDGTL